MKKLLVQELVIWSLFGLDERSVSWKKIIANSKQIDKGNYSNLESEIETVSG